MLPKLVCICLMTLSALAIQYFRSALFEPFAKLKTTRDVYTLPAPTQTVVLSLGYRAALADLINAHVLVSYGLHFQEKRLFETVDRYHELMTRFMVRGKTLFALGLVLSAIIYVNKFVIAWVVLRGLGATADLPHVLYMQLLLLLIFYFSPSPGASGFAEVTTIAVMGTVIPEGSEAAFVLLWRFFTLVLNMMIGAGVLVRNA